MSQEKVHKFEYRQYKNILKFKLDSIIINADIEETMEFCGNLNLDKKKPIKVLKYRGTSAHDGRAKKRRKIINENGIAYACIVKKNIKDY